MFLFLPSNASVFVFSVKLVSSRNALISCSACNSIGEIGRNGPLPLPAGVEEMEQGLCVSLMVVLKHFITSPYAEGHKRRQMFQELVLSVITVSATLKTFYNVRQLAAHQNLNLEGQEFVFCVDCTLVGFCQRNPPCH